MTIIDTIRQLAGPQRHNTFARAAQAAIALQAKLYVETGCYRGCIYDGQSTLIWAVLAQATGGRVISIDISGDSIDKAAELLDRYPHMAGSDAPVGLTKGDSLLVLPDIIGPIDVLYLDSYDHDPRDPEPCQRHQLAEAAIAVPNMAERSIILLDDADFDTGGKVKLSDPFIREAGFTQVSRGYQYLYHRGCEGLI